MKVRVLHEYYGCETGCCGHVVEVDDKSSRFDFIHNYSMTLSDAEWAVEYAKEKVKELWPECYDSCDWENVEVVGGC